MSDAVNLNSAQEGYPYNNPTVKEGNAHFKNPVEASTAGKGAPDTRQFELYLPIFRVQHQPTVP